MFFPSLYLRGNYFHVAIKVGFPMLEYKDSLAAKCKTDICSRNTMKKLAIDFFRHVSYSTALVKVLASHS